MPLAGRAGIDELRRLRVTVHPKGRSRRTTDPLLVGQRVWPHLELEDRRHAVGPALGVERGAAT